MDWITQPFNFQDLSGTFSVTDVVLSLILSFLLSAFIGWVYKTTHRDTSYTQSYVQTLVMMGMITSTIMLIVGSNIARACHPPDPKDVAAPRLHSGPRAHVSRSCSGYEAILNGSCRHRQRRSRPVKNDT